jgi:anti-anti-sigma regulatory factor
VSVQKVRVETVSNVPDLQTGAEENAAVLNTEGKRTAGKRLILRGDVGIADVNAVHAGALELSQAGGSAYLDLTEVGQMDVSVLQVLASLDAEFLGSPCPLQVTGASSATREQWKAAGWTGPRAA